MDTLPINFTDPAWINAIAMVVMAIAVLIASARLGVLTKQVKAAVSEFAVSREFQKRQVSLEAVRRYETDPQLRESIKHLWNKTVQGTDYSLLDPPDKFHVVTVLNYFDGIACGIMQGELIEPIVKDYLQFVLDKNVRALLRGESGPTWAGGDPVVAFEGYDTLLELHSKWVASTNQTLYEMLR